jgi:hypothetical protein
MRPIPINIAVEDLLSEAVAKRLLADSGRSFSIGVVYNLNYAQGRLGTPENPGLKQ